MFKNFLRLSLGAIGKRILMGYSGKEEAMQMLAFTIPRIETYKQLRLVKDSISPKIACSICI